MTFGNAEAKAICSYFHAKTVVPIAKAHSTNDKNRHCTVSCMLTLKCPAVDVLAAGTIKEVQDIFGSGNAEVADLEADIIGIEIARSRAATTNDQCLATCDLYYLQEQ